MIPDIINRADVWMVQGRSSAGLAAKALDGLSVLGSFFGEEFQRQAAAEPSVFGLLDHAHATAAKLFNDAIVADCLTDEGGQGHRRAFYAAAKCLSNRGNFLAFRPTAAWLIILPAEIPRCVIRPCARNT